MGIIGAELENFTIDQFAGATALILGSFGGLLMIIWKSRCHCKFNLCYVCQCERKPPADGTNDDSDEEQPSTAPLAQPALPSLPPSAPPSVISDTRRLSIVSTATQPSLVTEPAGEAAESIVSP